MAEPSEYQQKMGRSVAAFTGALHSMHTNLGKVQEGGNEVDALDLDSARVYLEAAAWRLDAVLARQAPAADLSVAERVARALYTGTEPWERLASTFRAGLIGEAEDMLRERYPKPETKENP